MFATANNKEAGGSSFSYPIVQYLDLEQLKMRRRADGKRRNLYN